ncbi:hypothetical protein [Halorhabdus amylolytica]|uniref:hypothetical protein n=1 Tax=Halorhabdus amylolytica TaxID=2559573 RepID=UPI0010A9B622|nr:hypothetical protein [Halorhabdus amylolytica]
MTAKSTDGDQFVQENKDTLVRILKHGDDEFVRALALSALVRYGSEPTLHDVESEIERAKEEV